MARKNQEAKSTVLLDVDTQYDLLPSLNSERIKMLKKWRRVMAWARKSHMPVISMALSNREDDNVLGQQMCVEHTEGHNKVSYTLLANCRRYDAEHSLDLPSDIMQKYHQVIFERHEFDPFMCDRFERLVNNFPYDHYVIFGGAFETSIKLAGLGLISRYKKVTLLKDAVSSIYDSEFDYVYKKLEAKGVEMISTDQFISKSIVSKPVKHDRNIHFDDKKEIESVS